MLVGGTVGTLFTTPTGPMAGIKAANKADIEIPNVVSKPVYKNVEAPKYFRGEDGKLYARSNETGRKTRMVNQQYAGKKHPDTGVPFDKYANPIFDSKADFQLKEESLLRSRNSHFREMDEELYNAVAVKKDVKIRSRFTKDELKFIEDNKKKPPNYTWHHHQEVGKMQLVDRV